MFRANIYGLNPFEKSIKTEIREGIEMLAVFMGHAVVSRECRIRIKTDQLGRINPATVGFGKLDKMVELHMIAAPLRQNRPEEYLQLGIAGVGKGWAFLDTSPQSARQEGYVRASSAHEAAHALGFLEPGTHQEDPASEGHCINPDCLMHKHLIEKTLQPDSAQNTSIRKLARAVTARAAPLRLGSQYDFCLDCKTDIRAYGDRNLQRLRAERTLYGSHI